MNLSKLIFAFAACIGTVANGATDIQTALDNTVLTFATGGDSAWFSQSSEVHTGSTALRSGKISDGQETWVRTAVKGSGELTFWWRASSESASYDWLEVSIDGVVWTKIGGTSVEAWGEQPLTVSGDGVHVIKWRYRKDGSVTSGEDCGWLDAVGWTGSVPSASDLPNLTFELNGGWWESQPVVFLGDAYGDLPMPKSGDRRVFAGWYYDAELTSRVLSSDVIPCRDMTLYAGWRHPVSLMDGDGLSFRSDENTWTFDPNGGWNGEAALVTEVEYYYSHYRASELGLSLEGVGTLMFKWKPESQDAPPNLQYEREDASGTWSSGSFYFDWDASLGRYKATDIYVDGWKCESLRLASPDACDILFSAYNYDSSRQPRYLMCDFSWTPAPEVMTVSFDADMDPNPYIAAQNYVPGDRYGELPVPTRIGWTFAGWRLGSVSGVEVRADDLVPFQEDVRLVACWKRSVSYMHDAGFSFRTEGEDKFYQTNVRTSTGGFFAGVSLTKYYRECGMCSSTSDDPRYTDKLSSLVTTVTGPGYLTFDWMVEAQTYRDDRYCSIEYASTSVSGSVLVDGKEVEDFYGWSTEQGGREQVYIPSGKHTLRWEVRGWPRFDETWNEDLDDYEYTLLSAPSLLIGDITFEKAGPQKTPAAWAGKLHDYNVFVTGDPAKFKKTYAGKIVKNANDYEARVFHALSLLAELAENADFKAFAKTFGYTFDYTHCQFVGTPKLNSKTAAVNTMVDKAIAVAVPAMKAALADLQAIPNDWTGTVTLDAEDWPLDETVALDIADVRFARAALQASIGTLYFLGGYDLTVDWAKAKAEADWHKPLLKVSNIPSVEDDVAWSRIGTVGDDVDGLEQVRVVQSGSKMGVLLTFADELEANERLMYADLYIRSGSVRYDLYVSCWTSGGCGPVFDTEEPSWSAYEGDEDSQKIAGQIQRSDKRLLIIYDCSKIKDFSKKSWNLDWGEVSVYDTQEARYRYADWHCDDCLAATQKVLMEQTKFLSKVRKMSHLTSSKSWIEKALNEALAADDAVQARTDDVMHFVEYDPQFAEIQRRARETTELVLQSLSEAVTVDFPQTLADFGSEEDIDFTLLPDNGVMRVYLGALFKGKITRAMKPKTHLNDKDELIANWSVLPDPTFGGLLPDMETGHYTALAETYGPVDTPLQYEPIVPGEKFSLDLSRYVGYAMSTTLPKGWTWDSKTGLLTGSTTKKLTLTLKGGGMTESVTLDVGPKPTVAVSIDEEEGEGVKGVTGSGAYAVNETVKVVAAMKSGYAFGGWYDEVGNLVSAGASYSFKMPRTDVSYVAKSVSLYDDYFELWLNAGWTDEPIELDVNEAADSSYGAYFEYETMSPCSISASGLPTGVKLAKVDGKYVLSGKATKKGVYYAKLSGKNNGNFKMSVIQKFVVGGATETFTNTAQIELERFEWGDPLTGYDYENCIPVPATQGKVKKVKLSGLPDGLSYRYPVSVIVDYEKDASGETDWDKPIYGNCLKISGVPAKAGLFTLTATVTYANGKTAKSQRKVVVFDSGSVYMPVSLEEGSEGRGTVSGGGVKSYGSTVKLVAKSKDAKKYFFAGWQKQTENWIDAPWENGSGSQIVPFGGNWSPATYSFTLKTDYWGGDIYGRFVTKAEDLIEFDSSTYEWRVEYALPACPLCEDVNPAWTSCPFGYTSTTKPTITATGLPAGTKLSGSSLVVSAPSKLKPGHYTVKLTAKNVSGNSATATVQVTIPNLTEAVDQGIIEGLNTSDEGYEFESGTMTQFNLLEELGVSVEKGWTLSVSGLPTGWTYKSGVISGTALVAKPVTVTFKVKKGTVSKVATATFNMTGLPSWAVGTYVGSTLTSYKGESAYEEGIMTMTVTKEGKISGSYAPSGDKTPFSGSGFTWADNGVLSATVKGKVDGKTKSFKVILTEEGAASFSGKISSSESIQTELLKRNPWTISGEAEDSLPVFNGVLTRSVGWTGYFKGKEQAGTLALAFGAKGTVKVTWKTAKGSSSASAQIADLNDAGKGLWSGCLVVGVAPNEKKNIAGAYCYVQFMLQTNESGVVQDVVVTDEWGYDNVWSFGYPPWCEFSPCNW